MSSCQAIVRPDLSKPKYFGTGSTRTLRRKVCRVLGNHVSIPQPGALILWAATLSSSFGTRACYIYLPINAGRTWDSTDASSDDNNTLANFGIGLRAIPSKFNIRKVLHLDIAWPLVDRGQVDSHQIIVSGQVDF